MYIRSLVYSHKVSSINQVRSLNRSLAKAQVGYSNTTGLFGIIEEVALCIHIGMVADNLNGVLVSANGAVGAQTPEFAGGGAFRNNLQVTASREGSIGNVVYDANGKVVFGFSRCQISKYCFDIAGQRVLGAQAITTTDDEWLAVAVVEGSAYIQIQRLTQGAGLFGAVQNSNAFNGFRNSLHEGIKGKGTIQVNNQHTNLLAFLIQCFSNGASGVTAGTHSYDDVFSIGSAIIVEQVVFTTGNFGDFGHIFLYHSRNCVIVGVNSFTSLEINIRVLSAAALNRVIRVQRAFAESIHSVLIQQLLQICVIHYFNLLDFVRGTEAIEEVQEGHAALDCS